MSGFKSLPIIKSFFKDKIQLPVFDHSQFISVNQSALNTLRTGLPLGKEVAEALSDSRNKITDQETKIFTQIESIRRAMLNDMNPLVDGSLGNAGVYDENISISQAANVSKPYKQALTLFQMVRKCKPNHILELGTNVGVSSSYLGAAANLNSKGKTVTMEASPYRSKQAKNLHAKLELKNMEYVLGLFSDTLDNYLAHCEPIDFAFIDGHHQYEPTLVYFDKIHAKSTDISVFFFDDIRWSEGMLKAWNEIIVDSRVIYSVDLNHTGFCICSRKEKSTPINLVITDVK